MTGRRNSRRRLRRPRQQRPIRARPLVYRWTASETLQRRPRTTLKPPCRVSGSYRCPHDCGGQQDASSKTTTMGLSTSSVDRSNPSRTTMRAVLPKLKNVDQTTKKDDAKKEDSSPDLDPKSLKQGGRSGGSVGPRINLLPRRSRHLRSQRGARVQFQYGGTATALSDLKFTVRGRRHARCARLQLSRVSKAPADH